MRSTFVYIRANCIPCIKLLINVYFLQIRFLLKNFLVQKLFGFAVFLSFIIFSIFNISVQNEIKMI